MMLTETHCHTKEVSQCAMVPAVCIPPLYQAAGYGAIIVTDHYNVCTLEALGGCRRDQIERWLGGYRLVKRAGEAIGMRVFSGMELALPGSPEEYLVYGFDEAFLFTYPQLAEYRLPRLFSVAEQEGLLIYQSHPCREYLKCAPPEFLHGVEVFNGNPRHQSHNSCAAAFAREHSLRAISGSDFHQPEDAGRGGIHLPESVTGNRQLACYLAGNEPELFVGPATYEERIG